MNESLLTNAETGKGQRINMKGDAWVTLTCESNDWEARKLLSNKETWNAETRQVTQVC